MSHPNGAGFHDGKASLDLLRPACQRSGMKTIRFSRVCAAAVCLLPIVYQLSPAALLAQEYEVHRFKKIQLSDLFWSEGANYGDFNKDGKMDVVSGPYWWEGPDFKVRHEYYPAKQQWLLGSISKIPVPGFEGVLGKNNTYADNFFAFTRDFNKDGWDDILIIGFPGKEAFWFENPARSRTSSGNEHWVRHKIFEVVDNESPTFTDITGDGKPEIICNSEGYFGYAEPDWNDASKPWTWHRASAKGGWQRFTHGLGIGDVNNDGRLDLMEANGWWEHPESPGGDWINHKEAFAPSHGSAHMYAYDVNGDGVNDVITSLAAHGYGLAWYEGKKDGDKISFTQHLIIGDKASDNKYGVKFSQLHAVDLVDIDGDGLKDIVTGKRIWAHGSHGDADPNDPAVLYWFKLVRNADKSADFIPYQIDNDSGIGTQVVAGDINGDGRPDIIVGNKKGTFVFLQEVKKVGKDEWEKAQPKVQVAAK